jgi:predicted metal-binding membrane protein
MTSAALRRGLPPGATRAGLVAALLVLAGAAWLVTDARMEGMDHGPGTELGGLGWFVGVWVTMMAAMMLPSAAPAVVAYARNQERSRATGNAEPGIATGLFAAGYLLAWAGAGVLGYAVIEGVRSLDLGFLAWDEAGQYVAGGAILAAALYQLTPLKGSCLRTCRDAMAVIRRHWRPGPVGALRLGAAHGRFCIGSSWALMGVLFAIGVMDVGLMFFVAALIAAEKLLPWRAIATRGIALVLAALAVAVAVAPEDVPGLTVPGSHKGPMHEGPMHQSPMMHE